MDVEFSYLPINDKMRDFHSSPIKHKALVGGFGSGKSYGLCAEVITLLMEYPGNVAAICRQTLGELDRSTRLVFQDLMPPEIVKRGYSISDHSIHFVNGSVALFFPLDEPEKIKSLNVGVVAIDEASEIREEMALMLRPRLRLNRVPRRYYLVASNPTTTNHWLYKWFVKDASEDFKVWHFSTYDNLANLPADYIDDLEKSLPPDLAERYIKGEWGHISFGERIYEDFGARVHVGKTKYNPDLLIIRGWDFGYYHPAVVFVQIDEKGRVRILAETQGKSRVIDYFAEDVITLGRKLFGDNVKYEDFGDIAGKFKPGSGVTTDTAIKTLKEKFGISVAVKRTSIKEGIMLIRRKLIGIVDGEPLITVDDTKCPILLEGFNGGYSCKKNAHGELLRDEPREDDYYEHTQDAFRYLMVGKFHADLTRREKKTGKLIQYRPAFPGSSW
jgi:hypothetical protein